jgi:hypothetical protein
MSHKCQSRPNAPQQKALLFDRLVGAGEHRRWNVEPECLGGLGIDHKLIPSCRRKAEKSLPKADICAKASASMLEPKAIIGQFYSIISVAVASSVAGMVKPSSLAVLRLMTNWYLVGA